MTRFVTKAITWFAVMASACLSAVGPRVAAEEPPPLQFAKAITFADIEREELVATDLDEFVFAATRDGLPDLRIIDGVGEFVPFLLRRAMTTRTLTVRNAWTPDDRKVELKEDGSLEITLTLDDDDPSPSGVRLITPLVDFERRLRVEAAVGDDRWRAIADGLLFDYSRIIDVRSDSLPLPADDAAAGARRFRITVDDLTLEQQSQLLELTRRLAGEGEVDRSERTTIRRQPFRIDRIEFWSERDEERTDGPRLVEYPLRDVAEHVDDDERKATTLIVPSRRIPLSRLVLSTDSRNFSRQVHVEARRSGGRDATWDRLASTTISRLDFRALQRESLTIELPETRAEELRVVIENRDSQPLENVSVEAEGPAYEIVFLAKPGTSYEVAYDGVDVDAPEFDIEAVAASLASYEPLPAKLGEQRVLTKTPFASTEPLFKRLVNNPIVLTLALATLAVALAVSLYWASRRVDDMPR